jgi:hypothetical protein
VLLDGTAREFVAKVRSENGDPGVLRAACVKLALEYHALCVPETNGVGAEMALRMRDAGCEMYRRPRRQSETFEAYHEERRKGRLDWVTTSGNGDANTRSLMVTSLQEGFRDRLGTPDSEIIHTALSWSPLEDEHLPDILAACGLATGAWQLLYGEMGAVAAVKAKLGPPVQMWRAGGRTPLPFRTA